MSFSIIFELATLFIAVRTLTAVRTFVGAEGLWSKSQKDAIQHLQRFVLTGDHDDFQKYQQELEIPLAGRDIRIDFERQQFQSSTMVKNLQVYNVREGDFPKIIGFMWKSGIVPQLSSAFDRWRDGDHFIVELVHLGQKIYTVSLGQDNRALFPAKLFLSEIARINDQLTSAENEFSVYLTRASRWIENFVMVILILVVGFTEGLSLILTMIFGRGLTRSLRDLNAAALRVSQGDYCQSVPVTSQDELGSLARSLNTLISNLKRQTSIRQTAEHASETKNLFLANMSHEIRTPLNAILGFSELLADPDLPNEERQRFSQIIKRTGASLTTIINDILDISKVEADQIEVEMQNFSLSQLMSDLYALLKMRCEEKGIELIFEARRIPSDQIQSDPSRLRQILANIIGNAIKFTDRGSVQVIYQVLNSQLVFWIHDTGGGIPADRVDRLFKPFSQGDDSVRKKYGGTGLGLMISRRLAQLLGGNVILLENRPTYGSTFEVRVHYEPASPRATAYLIDHVEPVPHGPAILAGVSVLVVEDSKDNQLLAGAFLTRVGAHVTFADNGRAGIEAVERGKFDAILMDLQMPVMDGYTAVRELRRKGYKTPIIALTGYTMKSDQEKCLSAGFDAYLSKPLERDRLISCVHKHAKGDRGPDSQPEQSLNFS